MIKSRTFFKNLLQHRLQKKIQTKLIQRKLSGTRVLKHGADEKKWEGVPRIDVHFILKDGTKKTVSAPIGMHILELAHKNDIELEGACEGSCACSTCHVIVDESYYDKIPEASDEENDMLDLAFGLTDTSRLGCQVTLTSELDGITLKLPVATRNMAVDGYVPKPH
eukprot:TRINITY_DN9517_c0_g1_i1.p1 TRINITY_DN9517_c0_g1~~TRINITY_DN9517_c0_g1_i1.p1  ORF type:complete len:166 (-),score=15.40 TRINITY_DN9517_c0_g1_i1:58-555(-)